MKIANKKGNQGREKEVKEEVGEETQREKVRSKEAGKVINTKE